jgi:FKBP-type peptidyl-prolyl cis-trans isomerase FklB
MKSLFLLSLAIFLPCFLHAQKAIMKNEKDSASYAVGIVEGEQLLQKMMQGGADTIINLDLFLEGYVDRIKNQTLLSGEESQFILMRFFSKLQEQVNATQEADQEKMREKYREQKEAGEKFLLENKNKPGIKENPSGLQFKIIKKGKGDFIKFDDNVKVNYTGTFTDGTEFDSNRGQEVFEFSFTPTSFIPAWTEILQLMKPGSQYIIYVPYQLGYGEMGQEPKVPPYSALIFDIEVVSVKKP